MKNAIHLSSIIVGYEMDSINELLRRFTTLINSTDGVLTGEMIWRNILHMLNISVKKEILEAFGIDNLEDKIYGIKSVILYKDVHTHDTFLLFKIKNQNEEDTGNHAVAEALAKVYAKLNALQEDTGVKIEVTIANDGIKIETSKSNLVYRIIIPKCALGTVIDATIPIENAIETAIKEVDKLKEW